MPRIKIDLPDSFAFTTEITVYVGHVNYGNHLDNAAVLALVSEARLRFLKAMGFSEMDVGGAGIIVADAAIQYRSEAFHGETLIFSMSASDFSRVGCDLVYQVHEKASGREVARGKTGIVFFDYATRTPVAVPALFVAQLAALNNPAG
jgi:acyl-CoA thioester hydrolase